MGNGFRDDFRDLGDLQVRHVFGPVQPIFELRENQPLLIAAVVDLIAGYPIQFGGQDSDAILTLYGNGSCEMNRHEIATIHNLPMWQSTGPKRDCFRLPTHDNIQ